MQRLCTRSGIARAGILAAFEADEVPARIDALLACGAAAGAGGAGGAPIARFAEKRLTDAIRAAILG